MADNVELAFMLKVRPRSVLSDYWQDLFTLYCASWYFIVNRRMQLQCSNKFKDYNYNADCNESGSHIGLYTRLQDCINITRHRRMTRTVRGQLKIHRLTSFCRPFYRWGIVKEFSRIVYCCAGLNIEAMRLLTQLHSNAKTVHIGSLTAMHIAGTDVGYFPVDGISVYIS